MVRDDYTWGMINGVVCIVDRIPRENIRAVLEDLREHSHINGHKVIYRDAKGRWDEIIIDHNAKFVGFNVLNLKDLDEAVARVRRGFE